MQTLSEKSVFRPQALHLNTQSNSFSTSPIIIHIFTLCVLCVQAAVEIIFRAVNEEEHMVCHLDSSSVRHQWIRKKNGRRANERMNDTQHSV